MLISYGDEMVYMLERWRTEEGEADADAALPRCGRRAGRWWVGGPCSLLMIPYPSFRTQSERTLPFLDSTHFFVFFLFLIP